MEKQTADSFSQNELNHETCTPVVPRVKSLLQIDSSGRPLTHRRRHSRPLFYVIALEKVNTGVSVLPSSQWEQSLLEPLHIRVTNVIVLSASHVTIFQITDAESRVVHVLCQKSLPASEATLAIHVSWL